MYNLFRLYNVSLQLHTVHWLLIILEAIKSWRLRFPMSFRFLLAIWKFLSHMSWRNMSRHVICHDINYIYFDSTLMFTIHIINIINVKQLLKTSTTIRITLFMIFIFYSYLAIYYIIMNEAVCIIRDYLCHDIKQAMSYHIIEFYVTTCCTSQLSWHP